MERIIIDQRISEKLEAALIPYLSNMYGKLKELEGRTIDILEQTQFISKKMNEQLDFLRRVENALVSKQLDTNNKPGVISTWLSDVKANWDATNKSQGLEKVMGLLATMEVTFNKILGVISVSSAIVAGMGFFKKLLGKTKISKESTLGDKSKGIWNGLKVLGERVKQEKKQIGGSAWNSAKSLGSKAADGVKWAGNKAVGGLQTGWKMTTQFGDKARGNMMSYSKKLLQLVKSVNLLSNAQKVLNLVMRMSPLSIVILGIGLLIEHWDKVKAVLGSVWVKFQETFPGLAKIVETYVGAILEFWAQLPGNILSALSGVYEIITGAFRSAFAWLSEKFNWVQGVWNGLFGDGDKNGGAGSGKVHSNARGGIVMQPILTTFAEAGPEAAIPLDGSSRAVSLWYTARRMLGMFDESRSALGAALPIGVGNGAGGGMVVSAPVNITINGNADSHTVRQIQQAAQVALLDLKRQRQERRVSFV